MTGVPPRFRSRFGSRQTFPGATFLQLADSASLSAGGEPWAGIVSLYLAARVSIASASRRPRHRTKTLRARSASSGASDGHARSASAQQQHGEIMRMLTQIQSAQRRQTEEMQILQATLQKLQDRVDAHELTLTPATPVDGMEAVWGRERPTYADAARDSDPRLLDDLFFRSSVSSPSAFPKLSCSRHTLS